VCYWYCHNNRCFLPSLQAGGNQSHNEAPIDFAGDMTGGDSEGILQNIDITDDLDLRDIFGSFGTFGK